MKLEENVEKGERHYRGKKRNKRKKNRLQTESFYN